MTLGILGGMGPMATAYFMERIVEMTKAETDQAHLEMVVYHIPSVPDRTAYLLGQSKENPVFPILEYAKKLSQQQVDCIAMPCFTAHCFHEEIETACEKKILHGIRETALLLQEKGIRRVGLLATDGTIQTGIFQKELEEKGVQTLLPDEKRQSFVMDLIYQDIKAGRRPDMDKFAQVSHFLFERGAQVVILGCTELSVIKRDFEIGRGYLDALEVLARKSILACGGQIRPQYEELFEIYEQ